MESRRRLPGRCVSRLLGEAAEDGGPTLDEAQRALDAARAERAGAQQAIGALEKGIAVAEQTASFAATERDHALAAVVGGDPALDRLIEAYDLARARVAALAEALGFLGPGLLRREHEHWYSLNRPVPPVEPVLPHSLAGMDRGAQRRRRRRAGAIDRLNLYGRLW